MMIRPATLDACDLETIVRHRRAMFHDMGHDDELALDMMSAKFREWLRPKMASGEYLAWFAVADDGSIAAGAGLWLMDWPPHIIGKAQQRGNILNVYTEPAHRKKGMARALMVAALGWCEEKVIDVVILHASPHGGALYEKLGFVPTNEMRLIRKQ